jgi:hypothetical protein
MVKGLIIGNELITLKNKNTSYTSLEETPVARRGQNEMSSN